MYPVCTVPVRRVAAQLGVDESTVRYRLARPPGTADGRRERPSALDGWATQLEGVLARFGDDVPAATVVHERLVAEYGFRGSYQAGPPVVQAQHDWFTGA